MADTKDLSEAAKRSSSDTNLTTPTSSSSASHGKGKRWKTKRPKMTASAPLSEQEQGSSEAAALAVSIERNNPERSRSPQESLLEDRKTSASSKDSTSNSTVPCPGDQECSSILALQLNEKAVTESSKEVLCADQAPASSPSKNLDSTYCRKFSTTASAASRPSGSNDLLAGQDASADTLDHVPQETPLPSVSVPQSPGSIQNEKRGSVIPQYGSALSPVSQRPVRHLDKEQRVGVACISCLAASALATAVVVTLAMFRSRNEDLNESCPGFDCQMAVRYMHSLIDTSIEPCKDFYNHVCHSWDSGSQGSLNFLDMAVRELETSLNWTLLSVGTGREQSYGAADLARFYASCHGFVAQASDHDVEEAMPVPLDLVVKDLSILHLGKTRNLLAHAIKLSLTRAISTVFRVTLVLHRGVVSMYISRGDTLAEKLGEANKTRLLVSYLGPLFNQTRTLLENETPLDEEEMIAAFDSFENEMKPLRGRQDTLEESTVSLLDSIDDVLRSSGWLQTVNAAYDGNVPLTKGSPLLSDCLVCVKNVIRLLATKQLYAPAYVFAHVLTEAGQFFYWKDKPGVTRASHTPSTCLRASCEVMPLPLWSNLFSNFSHSAVANDSRAQDMFQRIANLTSHAIATENMTVGTKDFVSSMQSFVTVSRAELFLYNATLSLATSRTGNVFEGIHEIVWKNFPSLYLTAKVLEASRRLRDPVPINHVVETNALLKGRVTYQAMHNNVILPPAMRRLPVTYPHSVPVEYNLGTTGVLMAKELFRAAMQSVTLDDPSWAKWYHKSVQVLQDCSDDATIVSTHFYRDKITSESAFEMRVWRHSLRVALSALKEYYLPKSGRVVYPDARWVLAQRTFFKRFCLLSCGGDGLESSFNKKLRCLLPVLSTSEFRDAFGCKKPQRKKLNATCSNL